MFADARMIVAAMSGLLASLLLASAFESYRRLAVLTSCIGAMLFFQLVPIPPEQTIAEWQWLQRDWVELKSGFPISIELGQAISWPIQIVLMGLLGSGAIFGFLIHARGKRSLLCWLTLQIVVVLAVTATDLAIVLLCWLVIEELVQHIAEQSKSQRTALLLPLRASSIVLLFGLVLVQTRYHSTALTTVMRVALKDSRIDAAATRDGIATVLVAAIVMRCGLFPFSLWLKRLLKSGSPLSLPLTVAVVLPAFALGVRMIPLWQAAPEAQRLQFWMGTVGIVPLLLIAFLNPSTRERCCLAVVAAVGAALMRSSAMSTFAWQFAVGALVIVALIMTIVALRAESRTVAAPDDGAQVTASPVSQNALRRLASRWFYLEEVINWCFATPIRWMAAFMEFVDRVVLCGSKEGAWAGHVRDFAEILDAIRLGRARYYALAVFWTAIGLGAAVVFGQ